jgi:hypothetical protein
MINSQKAAKQAELDKQYNDAKLRITREVESSIAALEKESQVCEAGEVGSYMGTGLGSHHFKHGYRRATSMG